MRRADRQIEILRLTKELENQRQIAITQSQQPLVLINRHPIIMLTVSALAIGAVARLALATPLPTAVKILGIPLLRQVASNALVMYQKTRRTEH